MLLGNILIDKFHIDPLDIEKGLQFQIKYHGLIGLILVNMGVISEEILVAALSEQLQLPTFKDIDRNALDFKGKISGEDLNITFLIERHWLLLGRKNDTYVFASVNPLDYEVNQYLNDQGISWDIYLVAESQFRELEGKFSLLQNTDGAGGFEGADMLDAEIDKLRELASEAPVVNLVNSLISRAVGQGASDLHCEPYKNMYRIRFRIDGILHDIEFLPLNMQLPITSRIKILSGMDIAESRRPQDGQISMKISSREIDVRVSTLPLAIGESLVLRFLLKEAVSYELSSLGLEKDLISFLKEDISKTAGVILLTGPTGSGKTTTLYSFLNRINREDKRIITIEDPIEYQLDGINQIQVQPEIGYDFLTSLRSILRQDPDVIMIGEIRDGETAKVAMQSSLTGHLVFSTLHTNDALTAYTRLNDLNVDEYLINSSLISVIAQRLVRKVCPDCAVPATLNSSEITTYGLDSLAKEFAIDSLNVMEAKGCPACNQTGYRGRVGIMEYLRCTPEIIGMPKDATFHLKAKAYMAENQVRKLVEDGLLKVIKGVTTLDEVFRVCG